jgi:tRNA(fMet)-specific endonuclease VapC
MRYLLDTNAVIALTNNTSPALSQRVRQLAIEDMAVSAVVMQEIYYGAYKSGRQSQNLAVADALQFEVIAFNQDDARQAGEIRAYLAAQGTPIGPYDVLIAGQALARDAVLVTRNTREFARVPGLRIENWES